MAEITIESYILENWQAPNETVELRIFANQYFVSLSGVVFQPPAVDQSNGVWYQAVTCTPDLTAKTLTIPQFILESTTDGQPNNATYQFVFYSGPSPSGIPIVSFFGLSNAVVGTSPTTTNIPNLINQNGQPAQSNLFSYYWVFFSIFSQFYAGVAFEDGDTTPSVFNHQTFYTANTTTTNITDFLNGYNQDVIWVFIGDSNTSIFGVLRAENSFLQFGFGVDGQWHEITAGASGITSINGLTVPVQLLETGVAGNDFNIDSVTDTHTFNIPSASSAARGLVTTGTQQIKGAKKFLDDVDVGSISADRRINFPNVNGGNTSFGGSSTAFGLDITLPDDAGTSGQVLSTDGTGNTLWVNNGGGGGTDWGIYDPRTYGAIGDGSTNDTTSFQAMLTAIGAITATVIIPRTSGPFLLGNITFPSNVTLDFFPGGAIQVVNSRTVLIQGLVIAQSTRIFFNANSIAAGQGEVSFGNGSAINSTDGFTPQQKDYWVEWWGAVGDDVTQSAAFLNAAFLALPNGCTMRLAGKFYYCEDEIHCNYKFQCTIKGLDTEVGIGNNNVTPVFVYHGTSAGTVFTGRNVYACTFKGFGIYTSNGNGGHLNEAATGFWLTYDEPSIGGNPSITSHCYLEAINVYALNSVRTDWKAFKVSNATGNNEQHTFRECSVIGTQSLGTTQTGISLEQTQVQRVIIDRCAFASVGVGIDIQGNVMASNNIFSAVGTCWHSQSANNNCIITGDDGETINNVVVVDSINGQLTVQFIACKYNDIRTHGDSYGSSPINNPAGASLSFDACTILSGGTGQDFGPYFYSGVVGNPASAPLWLKNVTVGTALDFNMYAPGFATGSVEVVSGNQTLKFGGNITTGTSRLLRAAAPTISGARELITMPGPTATSPPDPVTIAGAIGVSGLYPVVPYQVSVTGVTGTPKLYFFTIIAVDVKGRRSALMTRSNGDHFFSVTWNTTLDSSNYVTITWFSEFPAPDHYEVWDMNTANSVQWRKIANVAVGGTGIETYNVQASPAGPYLSTEPTFNEAGIINLRNLTLYPNDIQFTDGDATPSIALGNDFYTANTTPTTITNFDDGQAGQIIRVRIDDANTTIATNANIITGFPSNLPGVQGVTYTFKYVSAVWHSMFPFPPAEVLLATVAAVDLNTATPTTLFTVPTGRSCVITKATIRNASTSLTTVQVAFGFVSATFNDWQTAITLAQLTTSSNFRNVFALNGALIGTSAQVFKTLNQVLQGGAATVTMDVFGYLI